MFQVQEKTKDISQAKAAEVAFDDLEENLKIDVTKLLEELQGLKPSEPTVQGMKQLQEQIRQKRRALDNKQPERRKLQELCDKLADTKRSIKEAELSLLDAQWQRADSMGATLVDSSAKAIACWEEAEKKASDVQKVLNSVRSFLEKPCVPDSKASIICDQQLCKDNLERLKKARGLLEVSSGKWQILHQNLENTPQLMPIGLQNPYPVLEKEWQGLVDKVAKRCQLRDGQIVVLEDIEQEKRDIYEWLTKYETALQKTSAVPDDTRVLLDALSSELPEKIDAVNRLGQKAEEFTSSPDSVGLKGLVDVNQLKHRMTALQVAAANICAELEAQSGEEKVIREKLKSLDERIGAAKSVLSKLLEPSLETEEILKKTGEARHILNNLEPETECLSVVRQAIANFKKKHPSENCAQKLSQDEAALEKNLTACKALANKVINNLSSTLLKKPAEELKELEKQVQCTKEKLGWLALSEFTDLEALEVKLSWLANCQAQLNDMTEKHLTLKRYLAKLDTSELSHQALLGQLKKDCDAVKAACDELQKQVQDQSDTLKEVSSKWSDFQRQENQLQENLKCVQDKYQDLKNQLARGAIIDTKAREIGTLLTKDVEKLKEEAEQAGSLANELMDCCPCCDATQIAASVMSRCCIMASSLDELTKQLAKQDSARQAYDEAVKRFEDWRKKYTVGLEEFGGLDSSVLLTADSSQGGNPSLACQAKLNSLKNFIAEKAAGQELLNHSVALGEAIFGGLSTHGREAVRSELRGLRSDWEKLLDQLNRIEKKFESVLLQWSSFDDSFNQTSVWLADATQRLGSTLEKKPNLLDKKLLSQNMKAMCQELASHKKVLKDLTAKGQELQASQAVGNITQLNRDYENLCSDADQRKRVFEDWVLHHEDYSQHLER